MNYFFYTTIGKLGGTLGECNIGLWIFRWQFKTALTRFEGKAIAAQKHIKSVFIFYVPITIVNFILAERNATYLH